MVIHVFGNCSVQRRRNVVGMVTDKVVDVHVCCLSRPDRLLHESSEGIPADVFRFSAPACFT